jgi:hypothetical protein
MKRRSYTPNTIELELFPFLSVLACTIGTLVLLIIVITSQTLGSEKEVKIIARGESGINQTKIPRYIECKEDGIIIYPQETFVPKANITSANSALSSLIREVQANRNEEYLIVALRPTGIEVFKQVRSIIEDAGIDIGYEPINEGWTLKIENQ